MKQLIVEKFTYRRNLQKIFAIVLAVVSTNALAAHALPSMDFDGDGVSDFTSVSVDSDEDIAWTCRASSDGKSIDLGVFGSNGDNLIPGYWNDDTEPQLGVVYKNETTGAVTWEISDGQTAVEFGTQDDLFIAGADFDNSGKSDPTVVSRQTTKLIWTTKFDLLAGSDTTPLEGIAAFGLVGDKAFFANLDGSGDWRALLSQPKIGKYQLKFQNPRTLAQRKFKISRALYLAGRPTPVQQGDGTDVLVFARAVRGKTQVTTLSAAGAIIGSATFPFVGTLTVGDFDLTQPGEEIAVNSDSSIVIYNPISQSQSSIATTVTIPVDQVNVISFKSEEDAVITGCEPKTASDGAGRGFVWKPNSDTSYFAVAVMPGSLDGKVKKVEVFSKRGTYIKTLTFTGCGNPDSNGNRCNFKDFNLTGADYKRLYGGIILKLTLKRGCQTFLVSDPSQRID